jgi:hypothetical protein
MESDMIKIHDSLWVAIDPKRESLAYMTHYQQDSAFVGRMSTGLSWAGIKEEEAHTYENTPVEGFKIGESVSRWSTANKLFRVEDPRGFTVEVPTGNISTLLNLCTVEHGTVKEACVWGREGNNHILLPVSSEPYLQAVSDTKVLYERISFAKLNEGDVIQFDLDGQEYVYLGRYKTVWSIISKQCTLQEEGYGGYHWSRQMQWKAQASDETIDYQEFTDTKWRFLFKRFGQKKNSWGSILELKTSGKVIPTGKTSDDLSLPYKKDVYMTSELDKALREADISNYGANHNGVYTKVEVKEFIKKEK